MDKADKVVGPVTKQYPTDWNIRGEQVAIRYYVETAKLVETSARAYMFEIRNNVSMCWIDLQDAEKVLAITTGCEGCGGGGRRLRIFYPANQDAINRWNGQV